MKVKTSITSPKNCSRSLINAPSSTKDRSDFVEAAVWAFIGQMIRDEQNTKDLEIINRRADFLNQEA